GETHALESLPKNAMLVKRPISRARPHATPPTTMLRTIAIALRYATRIWMGFRASLIPLVIRYCFSSASFLKIVVNFPVSSPTGALGGRHGVALTHFTASPEAKIWNPAFSRPSTSADSTPMADGARARVERSRQRRTTSSIALGIRLSFCDGYL